MPLRDKRSNYGKRASPKWYETDEFLHLRDGYYELLALKGFSEEEEIMRGVHLDSPYLKSSSWNVSVRWQRAIQNGTLEFYQSASRYLHEGTFRNTHERKIWAMWVKGSSQPDIGAKLKLSIDQVKWATAAISKRMQKERDWYYTLAAMYNPALKPINYAEATGIPVKWIRKVLTRLRKEAKAMESAGIAPDDTHFEYIDAADQYVSPTNNTEGKPKDVLEYFKAKEHKTYGKKNNER